MTFMGPRHFGLCGPISPWKRMFKCIVSIRINVIYSLLGSSESFILKKLRHFHAPQVSWPLDTDHSDPRDGG